MWLYPWFNFAVALGLGLLIGIERERSKGEGPARRPAGIRTFALASLLGAAAVHVGGIPLLALAAGSLGVLAAATYFRQTDGDPGLTTEVALVLAPVIGGVSMSDVALASALGATVAVLLAVKTAVHRFVTRVLTDAELNDGLTFAIVALVVAPQLPNRYMGPFNALNPQKLWLVVVLVLAIGAAGHIATRLLGPRAGLPLAGFAAGFVSSTAAIGAMGARAAGEATAMAAAVAGATLSTVATFIELALLLLVVSEATLIVLAPALGAGGLVAAIYGGFFTLRALKEKAPKAPEQGRAFSIVTALLLAATVAVMLVVAAGLREYVGETGIILGAGIAGIADAHSSSVSIASLVAAQKLEAYAAAVPILTAMTTNTGSKIVMALGAGSAGFAWRVVPGLVLSIAASWGAALLTLFG
jgi:uncharacterized membrane protein (DUF4010 family)